MKFLKPLKKSLFASFRSFMKNVAKAAKPKRPKAKKRKPVTAKMKVKRTVRNVKPAKKPVKPLKVKVKLKPSLKPPKTPKKVKVSKKQKARAQSFLKASSKYLKQPPKPKGKLIGTVTHFFPNVNAAVIKMKSGLKVGDRVRFEGATTEFEEQVKSMQINRVPITEARSGQEIGLQVKDRVREGDLVYKMNL